MEISGRGEAFLPDGSEIGLHSHPNAVQTSIIVNTLFRVIVYTLSREIVYTLSRVIVYNLKADTALTGWCPRVCPYESYLLFKPKM